jgi:hypothetical protein
MVNKMDKVRDELQKELKNLVNFFLILKLENGLR